MSFKDDLLYDVENTFLNDLEFAEIHNVDGKEMLAVVDEYEAKKVEAEADKLDGVHRKHVLLYVAKSAFSKKPSAGNRIFKLDGKKYIVYEVDEEGDMYIITLEVFTGV